MFLYIDPGTGSILLSLIVGFILSLKDFFIDLYYKTISLFIKNKYKGTHDFTDELVFFSEGKKYWKVFKPILECLENMNVKFIFLSADLNDPGLLFNSKKSSSHYIGNMNQAVRVLNKLKATMCVTTTPQLDILEWKYSKNVKHYCYIYHSPIDIHSYKKFAFDYYDSILCTSNYQLKNIRQLEIIRNSKKKILKKTGCTYFDLSISKTATSNNDYILIAPTWGDRSFFKNSGELLVQVLLKHGYKIIYRPHPQSWISDIELLNQIKLKFGNNKMFSIDKAIDNSISLSKSKAMITDISSGIIYDVAFLYKIPVIAVNFEWDDGGYESSSLNVSASSNYLLKDYGKLIMEDELNRIDKIIEEALNVEITKEIMDKHIFNFKNSSKFASNQIISIFNNIKNQ